MVSENHTLERSRQRTQNFLKEQAQYVITKDKLAFLSKALLGNEDPEQAKVISKATGEYDRVEAIILKAAIGFAAEESRPLTIGDVVTAYWHHHDKYMIRSEVVKIQGLHGHEYPTLVTKGAGRLICAIETMLLAAYLSTPRANINSYAELEADYLNSENRPCTGTFGVRTAPNMLRDLREAELITAAEFGKHCPLTDDQIGKLRNWDFEPKGGRTRTDSEDKK